MATKMTIATPPAKNNKEQGCNKVQKGWNRNTDLCVDVKTILRKDRVAKFGKEYQGVLTHDRVDHYQFVETLPSVVEKRNPHVFTGEYITVTRRDDGSLHPYFRPKRVVEGFNVDTYAIGVMEELREAFKGLVEEGVSM